MSTTAAEARKALERARRGELDLRPIGELLTGKWDQDFPAALLEIAASPSPASPADDVAGLIERLNEDAAYIESYSGFIGNPDYIARNQRTAAAALSRLQTELAVEKAARDNDFTAWAADRRRAEAAEDRLATTETDLHRTRVMWDETAARQVKLEISAATMREALTNVKRVCTPDMAAYAIADAALRAQHG